MLTVNDITELLKTQDDPFTLSEYLTVLSAWASAHSETMKKIQLIKPAKWLEIQNAGAKPLSDKKTDMNWYATPEGQGELACKYELQRIETMCSAIKQRLYAQRVEFRSMNPQI